MSAKLDEPSYMNAENDTINDWIRFGARICVTTAFHPIEQAKVLIQVCVFLKKKKNAKFRHKKSHFSIVGL